MRPQHTRQLDLFVQENRVWEQLPEPSRHLVRDLLNRLLGEVIRAEGREERSEADE